MKTFQVNDMTCGHCVDAVTKAIERIAPVANVSVNLETKRLEVDSAAADVRSIQSAIAVAGYTTVEETGSAEPVQGPRSSSCCGSCH